MHLISYLSAVLQRPGELATQWWAQRRRYLLAAVVLGCLVGLATAAMALLQAYHPAWALVRQPRLSATQLAALHGHRSYWGTYHNLRQLALLPLFALPTWAVYRRQGVRYADALFMQMLWNTAYTLLALGLVGLMALQVVPITFTGNGLALLLLLGYLVAIGHTTLDLRWSVAALKAVFTLGLVVACLRLLTCWGL
ncbi:hypothetical protein [Hymenobacter negativus]|uniref:Uncharacterized protein n=1 Tax=Hymenobacter negativus TaxID=2795026 RepID=A0ABS3QE78_9BACT|nr:hypothetical protein [Hymenobacter negativus]MBO2009025.1 hypothetical protein [Hymenobacter negativus]